MPISSPHTEPPKNAALPAIAAVNALLDYQIETSKTMLHARIQWERMQTALRMFSKIVEQAPETREVACAAMKQEMDEVTDELEKIFHNYS